MTLSKKIRQLFLTTTLSAVLVFSAGSSFAQEGSEHTIKTLRDALAVGVSTNPEYGVVAASRRATDEELNQGEALFLPSIDLTGEAGYEYTDSPGTRSGASSDTEDLFRKQIGVTLTQMLFDGFDAHYEVKRQEARVKSSADRVRETTEFIGLSVVEAYLEVLRQRKLLGISRENVSAHKKIQRQIRDSIDAGRSTSADGSQVNARLSAARAAEASTLEALRIAEAEYRREVGDIAGDLQMPVVPYEALAEDVELEVDQALANSPTLDVFASDIEVAYAESQGTKATQYPQFDLRLNANSAEDINGVQGHDESASALVVMNWNLYRGGADVARAREFVHRHQQSKEERSQGERNLENDVRQTWASMVSSAKRAAQFSSQAVSNRNVVRAYKDQFSLDRRTLLDVLDSQNELFVSRSNTINAEFVEMFAIYRLMALKGSLLPTMGIDYPRETVVDAGSEWTYETRQEAR